MKPLISFVTSLLLPVLATGAWADDYYWINSTGGDYGDTNNWSDSTVPTSSDNAFFELDAAYSVTFDNNYTVSRIRLNDGQISFDLNSYQYDIEWTQVGDDAVNLGYDADAELTVINGGGVFSGNVIIGREVTSHGILNIEGPDTLWKVRRGVDWYSLFIGGNGRGDLNISNGGTMDCGAGSAATHYPSQAFVTVDGLDSLWRVDGYLAMGDNGIAEVRVTNQGAVNIGKCDMASNPSAVAFMTLIGKDLDNHSEFYLRSFSETSLTIGRYGSAHLTCLNNGKIINEGYCAIAAYPGSFGELTLSQSSADIWRSAAIGGTLDTAGGTAIVNILRDGRLNVGQNDPGDAIIIWPEGSVKLCLGGINLDVTDNPRALTVHGRLSGVGTVNNDVLNPDGVVAPGVGFNLPQDLEILSDYTQGPDASLNITIIPFIGVTPPYYHGRLYVSNGGIATLDGLLNVTLSDYIPDPSDTFTIVSAPAGLEGRFVNTPGDVYYGTTCVFDVQYNSDSVILTNYRQPCFNPPTGDANLDCIVNLKDFDALAQSWLDDTCSSSDRYCNGADIDKDGTVDIDDFTQLADYWLTDNSIPGE